jgi:hypothetical protein
VERRCTVRLGSSYNKDTWELTIHQDGERRVYKDVSPFHNDEFYKRAHSGDLDGAVEYVEGFELADPE